MVAKERFGDNYQFINNESNTFILCFEKDVKKNNPHISLHYFVYDLCKEKIVAEEKLIDAEINWLDDSNLEIRITPEVISEDEISIFRLNVLTGKKVKSN